MRIFTASILSFIAASFLLAGCKIGYYRQATAGQIDLWNRQVPSATLLGQPETEKALRDRLLLAQELLAFAENELHLEVGKNYHSYADLERDFVVWSVFAAPELDVEPIKWRFPVVGRLAYRGYFKQEDANAFAEGLKGDGHDYKTI
ncbi:MAG: aminopeptidase [Verrucomicrobiota bacterium]